MVAKAMAQESAKSQVRRWNVQCSKPSKTPDLARKTGNLDRNPTGDQAWRGFRSLPWPVGARRPARSAHELALGIDSTVPFESPRG